MGCRHTHLRDGHCSYCDPPLTPHVHVGDVFRAYSTGPKGRREGTRYWVVLAVTARSVHLLGLNAQGEAVSTSTYGLHVMQHRRRLARIKAVAPFIESLLGAAP